MSHADYYESYHEALVSPCRSDVPALFVVAGEPDPAMLVYTKNKKKMKKLVEEIKEHVCFKNTTEVGDLVLLIAKEPQMLVYALVTNIERDETRKDEWWHVQMNILTVPPQPMTWTLRMEQFTGQEIFTMGGEERFVQAVDFALKKPEKKSTPPSKKVGLRRV